MIGFVNFLSDPSQPKHMNLSEIDRGMGVSEATGNAKSMAIRKLLKIHRLDPEWTLPSKMDDNLLAWLVEVNGIPVDARMAPRELQIEASAWASFPTCQAIWTAICDVNGNGRSGGLAAGFIRAGRSRHFRRNARTHLAAA